MTLQRAEPPRDLCIRPKARSCRHHISVGKCTPVSRHPRLKDWPRRSDSHVSPACVGQLCAMYAPPNTNAKARTMAVTLDIRQRSYHGLGLMMASQNLGMA